MVARCTPSKVRGYLYGCTRLDGDTFDYFASPKAVLRGRIVAVAIFVAYALAGEVYPPAHFAFWAIGALALPWLLVKSLSFNARNSAYRGLRFDFEATPGQAARIYLGRLLVVVFTAWLVWLLPLVPIYAGYAVGYAFLQARTANLFWSHVQGEGMRFASTLSAWG